MQLDPCLMVVFKRYRLSRVRHLPFKEDRRALDRRQTRRFVRRIKTEFLLKAEG